MKHKSSQAVFAYWNEQRGQSPAPKRSYIDPAAIRHALGDSIILSADFVDRLRFRLAGTRVCALFERELKGEAFVGLWSEASRPSIVELLAVLTNEAIGTVAGSTGRTADGDEVDLEVLLLPLAHHGHARTRALGVLAPLQPPYWLGEKPVIELELRTTRHVGAGIEHYSMPELLGAPEGGRLRHGFVVYSGGRERPPGERTG